MKKWLLDLLTRGSFGSDPFSFIRTQISKIAYLCFVVVALCYAVFYYLHQIPTLMALELLGAGCGLLGLYIISKGKVRLSQYLVVTSAVLLTAAPNVYLGSEYGIYFFYFPIILGTILVFEAKSVALGFAITCVALICAAWNYFYGHIASEDVLFLIKDYKSVMLEINFALALAISFSMMAISHFIFWAVHKSSEEAKIIAMNNSRLLVLGKMASGVAHEINNPLAIIQMRIEVLMQKLKGPKPPAPEEVSSQLVFIEKAGQRIHRIVRGLHLFSKKTGDGPMQPASLKKIFADIIELSTEFMAKKRINLEFAEVPDVQILCYEPQLSQAIMHVLNNAADAVETIDTKWIRVSFHLSEGLTIRFQDSGRGISDAIHHRIFDPFFTTKLVGQGTGLGLSISDSIMQTHGGVIRYKLVDNHTCFELVFPATSVVAMPDSLVTRKAS